MNNKNIWSIKSLDGLSGTELYQILRLRSEVFVVEQSCIYQDIDSKDVCAMHICCYLNNELAAYCRIFRPNDYFDEASIGRVVVKKKYRNSGLGNDLMDVAIDNIEKTFGEKNIVISAQLYLKQFYENHKFIKISDEYLEDDIPHVRMRRSG